MDFRVAEIKDIRVDGIKAKFGSGIKAIWIRLHEKQRPRLEIYLNAFDGKMLSEKNLQGSRLRIMPQDVTDLNISFVLVYEFKKGKVWLRSENEEPDRRTHVYKISEIRQGVDYIKGKIASFYSHPKL